MIVNKRAQKFVKRANKELKPYKKDAAKFCNKQQKHLVRSFKKSDKARLVAGVGLFASGVILGAAIKKL